MTLPSSYKPAGQTDLAPYLLVTDARATLAFCEEAFGAERLSVIERPDGGVMHAECRIGDSIVMMGEASGPAAMLHLYLPDPDAAFARAVELGAEVLEPISAKPEGARRGGVRAPDGTMWYLAAMTSRA